MTEIRESITLDVPAARAEQCVLEAFERYRTPAGDIEMPLAGAIMVRVHVSKRRDAQNLNDEIALRWEPESGQMFPVFDGTLTLWNETPEKTNVELRGTYEPPLGAAGKVFDDAVGRAIALQTARQFLFALAEGAQTLYGLR